MNGHKTVKPQLSLAPAPVEQPSQFPDNSLPNSHVYDNSFDQPVLLQQSPVWSRAIIWGIMGTTTAVLIWANIAKIDEAIPAVGQLEPIGEVKEVQTPVGGVVKTVYIKDGQKVKLGEMLLSMTPTVPIAQLASLKDIRTALLQENQFYRTQMSQPNGVNTLDRVQIKLPAELESLTKSRSTLAAENQLYRAELNGASQGVNFNPEQKQRWQSSAAESNSRAAAAELEVAQLQKQANQNRVQRAGSQNLLISSQTVLRDVNSGAEFKIAQMSKQADQNQVKRVGIKKVLDINQRILTDIRPAFEAGAIARVQVLKQQQEVSTRQNDIDQLDTEQARLQLEKSQTRALARAESLRQQQEVSKHSTEIEQLDEEYARLQLAISQASEKLKNTVAVSQKDLLDKIAKNEQSLAEIDSQLTKAIVENHKKISEIDSQISQASLSVEYQELRAPVAGTVFELKAKGAGFVANASEPVVKIVPDDNLVAAVFITNKDIGFVKPGMEVDVRIDSFPFSEFGDIKGRLVSIGSDALPPDQIHPFYRFSAKVSLEKQFLVVKGKQVALQSGMSMSGNIKIRSRTVMSIFTDLFTQQVESLKSVR